jgi:uncharacterized integral membrane protein
MKNAKLAVAALVAVLAVVVFLQNIQEVQLQVLWVATVRTSLATALFGAFAVGALTGALAFGYHRRRKGRGES